LEILDISDNDISHGGAEQLAKSLCHSWPDLVELKIAKNDIGSDGVMVILGSMVTRSDKDNNSTEKNDKIKTLDLSYTNCGADGARAALMSGGVSALRLFGNKIGSEGFQAIAPLLRGGHPNIENLDLGGNNADEDSVVILLDAIAETSNDDSPDSRLVVLEIGGNKFGENAMEALNRVKSVWPDLDVAHDKPVGESEWKEEGR
jgi:Ran GTPase-activating protein (RanGAP) involved in mRNA processing and transport